MQTVNLKSSISTRGPSVSRISSLNLKAVISMVSQPNIELHETDLEGIRKRDQGERVKSNAHETSFLMRANKKSWGNRLSQYDRDSSVLIINLIAWPHSSPTFSPTEGHPPTHAIASFHHPPLLDRRIR